MDTKKHHQVIRVLGWHHCWNKYALVRGRNELKRKQKLKFLNNKEKKNDSPVHIQEISFFIATFIYIYTRINVLISVGYP